MVKWLTAKEQHRLLNYLGGAADETVDANERDAAIHVLAETLGRARTRRALTERFQMRGIDADRKCADAEAMTVYFHIPVAFDVRPVATSGWLVTTISR